MKASTVTLLVLAAAVCVGCAHAEANNAEAKPLEISPKKFLDLLPALRGGVKSPEATCSSAGFDNRCATAYQACCIAYQAKGFPCDCHLTDGSGKSGQDCGTCGTAYAACCVGFAARGHPCTCDVEKN